MLARGATAFPKAIPGEGCLEKQIGSVWRPRLLELLPWGWRGSQRGGARREGTSKRRWPRARASRRRVDGSLEHVRAGGSVEQNTLAFSSVATGPTTASSSGVTMEGTTKGGSGAMGTTEEPWALV